jgi:hypothetical protein
MKSSTQLSSSRLLIAVSICCVSASTASTAPIQWPVASGGNGHYYEEVAIPAPGMNWLQAKAAAEALTFNGWAGHLVTLMSKAENDFVVLNATGGTIEGVWLGGYQDTTAPDYSEPGGGWRWVTGEPWAYAAWRFGMPDEYVAHQDYLRGIAFGTWDDIELSPPFSPVWVDRFIVEYEPVPEPSALALAAIGATLITGMAARRRATKPRRPCSTRYIS